MKGIKILIVEDSAADAELLERELRRKDVDFLSKIVETEEDFIRAIQEFSPDIILSDYDLPVFNGLTAFKLSQEMCPDAPFIIVSGAIKEDTAIELINQGATDYIRKDHIVRLAPSVKRALREAHELSELRNKEQELLIGEEHYRRMADKAMKGKEAFFNMLEDVNEAFKELEILFMTLVSTMVNALDAKSPWTKGHSLSVAMYAEQIAKEMALKEEEIKDIRLAGILHDIGKIGTYDYLLDKPEKLTDEEFAIVKKHPAKSAEILKDIKQLKKILPIIRHHHERIDGRGYPDGIKGEDIPFGAKILHVADSFDAMTADRPYRPAPGKEYAILEFKRCNGTQFDPQVVEAFLKLLGRSQE